MTQLNNAALAIVAIAVLMGCNGPQSAGGNLQELHEASMNFDMETLSGFLPRLARLVDSGFGPDEIGQVMDLARSLGIDAEGLREYRVTFNGAEMPLRVQVVMDDAEAPDVYFFTARDLARAITDEMIAFGEELGI